MCHETTAKCEVQLFKHTSDTEEAVESMYYKEEYDSDEYPDYEIEKTDWRPLSGAALKARLRETGYGDDQHGCGDFSFRDDSYQTLLLFAQQY